MAVCNVKNVTHHDELCCVFSLELNIEEVNAALKHGMRFFFNI